MVRILVVLALFASILPAATEPLLSPVPKRLIAGEIFPYPTAYRIELAGLPEMRDDPGLARVVEALERRGSRPAADAAFVIELGLCAQSPACRAALAALTPSDHLSEHPEAHFIRLDAGGALVGGNSPRAVYYALSALSQWLDSDAPSLPGGTLLDWPSLSHRAYMIDSARLMEQKDYYRKMLRILSESRYNIMLLHLTDYPGITLRYDSHPDPADPNAWTPEEIGELHQLAARYHVDLMPEVELFGHAGGWTRHPKYRELGEGRGGGSFNPQNPETYRLTGDLVEETAKLFSFPLFHAGLDEVNYPTSPEGRAYAEQHGMNRWLTDHIQKIHAQITAEGKRMVMWGDMLHKRPGTAFAIPRDTLIYDWQYYTMMDGDWRNAHSQAEPPGSWSYLRQLGFEVVAAPSLMCSPHRIWPDAERVNNSIGTATRAAEYGLLGTAVTVWAPSRYVPDSLWYGTVLAGDAAWAGLTFDRQVSEVRFFRSFHGLEWDDADRRHLTWMLEHTPYRDELAGLQWGGDGWQERFAKLTGGRLFGELGAARAAVAHWQARRGAVRRHGDEFDDLILVARVLENLAWRAEHGKATLAGDTALLKENLAHTRALHADLVTSWNRSRYGDPSEGKLHDPMPFGFLVAEVYQTLRALEGLAEE